MFPHILASIFYTVPIYLLGLFLYYHKSRNNANSVLLFFYSYILYLKLIYIIRILAKKELPEVVLLYS